MGEWYLSVSTTILLWVKLIYTNPSVGQSILTSWPGFLWFCQTYLGEESCGQPVCPNLSVQIVCNNFNHCRCLHSSEVWTRTFVIAINFNRMQCCKRLFESISNSVFTEQWGVYVWKLFHILVLKHFFFLTLKGQRASSHLLVLGSTSLPNFYELQLELWEPSTATSV